jgi:hypothetical protein
MAVTGRRNNLFRVLDSVESATIVGTSRRPGQTVARAQGITEKNDLHPSRASMPRYTIFMRLGAPPAHGRLSRNSFCQWNHPAPKGPKRVAGGTRPRLGYCIKKAPAGAKDTLFQGLSVAPAGARRCLCMPPRAHARGCYGVTCQCIFPEHVFAGCSGTMLLVSGHVVLNSS